MPLSTPTIGKQPRSDPYPMTIGGEPHCADAGFDVANPATGQTICEVSLCSSDQLNAAIHCAERAFDSWRANLPKRRQALASCAETLRARSDEIARLITQEQGKPLFESRSEVNYAAGLFDEYAFQPFPERVLADNHQVTTKLVHVPIGVAALITPWNFPIGTAAVKIAPALLMGNTVVLKPSPHAPLAALKLGQLLSDHLPSGALNVIAGGNDLGEALIKDPRIGKISLTGSLETGQRVMSLAGADLKRVTLELGGNDPAIVLDDAPIIPTAQMIIKAAFRNAGQVCSAIKRVYVPESLHDALIAALVAECEAYRLGNGLDPATTMGPLTTAKQVDTVDRFVSESISAGAQREIGGSRARGIGHFFRPTLLSRVPDDSKLASEEQFGPALPILSYRKIDDAIERANNTPYGLSASVWTSNASRGVSIAEQLDCGRVGINGHKRSKALAPFGGFKKSGIGRELGRWGSQAMSEPKVINVFK